MKNTLILSFFTTLLFFSCTKENPLIGDDQFIQEEQLRILLAPCGDINTLDYPIEHCDDYLHPERFAGLQHCVIMDHLVTRKMVNVLVPSIGYYANLCDVTLEIQNPYTFTWSVYYDVFNDPSGVFNMNKRIHDDMATVEYPMNTGVKIFNIKMYQASTGIDYTFGKPKVIIHLGGL